MAAESDGVTVEWREMVAVGIVAGDLSSIAIARYGGFDPDEAVRALDSARAAGVIGSDGSIDGATADQLRSRLTAHRTAEVHAAVARHLLAVGTDTVKVAIDHARSAGALAASSDIVKLADAGGHVKLSVGDHESARELLQLAVDLDSSGDAHAHGRRLLALAAALHGIGRIREARDVLLRAAQVADSHGDTSLLARTAVTCAVPPTFDDGDIQAAALLQQAAERDLTDEDRIMVDAARGWVEMRIPITTDDGRRVAWVSRPEVAQPLTERAESTSRGRNDGVRALAALAWRATHRGPLFLDRRLEVSDEALRLAQRQRLPVLQVDAAAYLAVDALESGDRTLYDRSVAAARWVAERDGNPRLIWRALMLSMGAALLDGDHQRAAEQIAEAERLGAQHDLPLWQAAAAYHFGCTTLLRDDPDELRRLVMPATDPLLLNPDGRAGMSYCLVRTGDTEGARRFVARTLGQIDTEMSMLMVGCRLAATVLLLDDAVLRRETIDLLSPWADHVAVDVNGWWSEGPVAIPLAELHAAEGDLLTSRRLAEHGLALARRIDDRRSTDRAVGLLARLTTGPTTVVDDRLSQRQHEVLALVVEGCTNAEIARRLSYSVSTVKSEVATILREWQLSNRSQIAAHAAVLGLDRATRRA